MASDDIERAMRLHDQAEQMFRETQGLTCEVCGVEKDLDAGGWQLRGSSGRGEVVDALVVRCPVCAAEVDDAC